MEVVKVLYEAIQLVVVPFFPSFSHGGKAKSSAISTNHEKHIFSTEITNKKQETLHICYRDSKYSMPQSKVTEAGSNHQTT